MLEPSQGVILHLLHLQIKVGLHGCEHVENLVLIINYQTRLHRLWVSWLTHQNPLVDVGELELLIGHRGNRRSHGNTLQNTRFVMLVQLTVTSTAVGLAGIFIDCSLLDFLITIRDSNHLQRVNFLVINNLVVLFSLGPKVNTKLANHHQPPTHHHHYHHPL